LIVTKSRSIALNALSSRPTLMSASDGAHVPSSSVAGTGSEASVEM